MKYKVGTVIEFNDNVRHGIGEIVETDSGTGNCLYLVKLLGEHAGKGHKGKGFSKKKYKTNDYYFISECSVVSDVKTEEIHITRKGSEVHAVLKNGGEVVDRSKAVCSPEDEFDFWKGSSLAYSRLIAHTCENTKADPEPEYVEIVSGEGIANGYKVGDVCKVLENFTEVYKLSRISDELIQIVSKTDTKSLKAVKRAAKPGEYVMLVKKYKLSFSFDDIGNIMKAKFANSHGVKCDSHDYVVFQEEPQEGLWPYLNNEFVVLEGYEPPKKFVPHLKHTNLGYDYGTIGKETPLKDVTGKALYVGDLVIAIETETGRIAQPNFVVYSDTITGKKDFVRGIEMVCKKTGEIEGFVVVKQKSYKDLKNGEVHAGIKAVTEE